MAHVVSNLEDDGNTEEVADNTTPKNTVENRRVPPPVETRWKPGQSGNPGGRPKTLAEFKRLAAEHTPDALQAVIDIMNDPRARQADRIRAAELLMDRTYGRPSQEMLIGGVPGSPLELSNATPALDTSRLSATQRAQLADILASMVPPAE